MIAESNILYEKNAAKIDKNGIPNTTKTERDMCIMELEKLKKIIVEVLNVDEDEISENTTFIDDLGADSLDIFQIIMGIEEEFDIEIPTEEAEKISTVGDAVEQIKNALS